MVNQKYIDIVKKYYSSNDLIVKQAERLQMLDRILSENYRKNYGMGRERFSSMRKKVFERDLYTCQKCGQQNGKGNDVPLHIDHIVPIKYGGSSNMDNLQVLCQKCNLKKSARIE